MSSLKFKVKHKTGWTGTLEIELNRQTSWGSHRASLELVGYLFQDSRTPEGNYVEDPDIESLDDLELTPIEGDKQ